MARRFRSDFSLARPTWVIPAGLFLAVFFVMPLLHNAWRSVSEDEAAANAFAYYLKLLFDPYYRQVLWSTLRVSAIVTAQCLLLGYPVAYFLVRYADRWRTFIIFCLITPLLTSVIMRTVGIRLLLARRGAINAVLEGWMGLPPLPSDLLNGPFSVYLGMVQVLVPFMVLSIAPIIQRVEPSIEEAAGVLGASRWRTFLHVTLPLSREGIYTGCILVLMMANGSFVTQLLLGGGKVVTMPVLIFQAFNVTQDTAFAGAMGNVLLLLSLACLALQTALVGRRGR